MVNTEGKTKEEYLAEAKMKVVRQMEEKFPRFQYSVTEGAALLMEEAHPGVIVEDATGRIGIIFGKNKKTIDVKLANGAGIQGPASAFKRSAKSFEEARAKRPDWMREENVWSKGYGGYLENKGEKIPVITGNGRGKKIKFHVINETGSCYELTEAQCVLVRDEL